MATVDLGELVEVSAVPVSKSLCQDCSWHSRTHVAKQPVLTAQEVRQAAKLHATHKPGHRVVVTVTTETAYCMP